MGRATTLLLAALAAGLTMSATAQTTGDCNLGSATADLDVGNVRARMYNTGGLFWNGGPPVYEVPKGSGSNAIFASGLWIGRARRRRTPDGGRYLLRLGVLAGTAR